MAQPVRFSQSYNGYNPSTIFDVNQNTKTLTPYASGDLYQQAGYQFGQEQVGNPADYAGYNIGSPITRADQLAQIKNQLNQYQSDAFNTPDPNTTRQSSSLTDSISKEQGNYDTYLSQFNDLSAKLKALSAPNYQQAY